MRPKTLGVTSIAVPAVLVLLSAFAGVTAGCGSSDSATADAKLPASTRSSAVEHEACSESGKVEALDANGDGKPDIKRVYSGGKETCRITDLNHDGKPDMYEYYDAAGQVRRRESDYDDSGVVDAIERYEGGKLASRELDTTGQHRIDTWDFFDVATGKRTRRERDANGDGVIDQWWTYEGDKVTIAFDKNVDGKPDPNDTVVLGAGGNPIAAAPVDAGPPPSTASALGSGDAGYTAPTTPTTAGDASILNSAPVDAGHSAKADAGKAGAKK
jgi:hypothetical protein